MARGVREPTARYRELPALLVYVHTVGPGPHGVGMCDSCGGDGHPELHVYRVDLNGEAVSETQLCTACVEGVPLPG